MDPAWSSDCWQDTLGWLSVDQDLLLRIWQVRALPILSHPNSLCEKGPGWRLP